MQSYGIIVAFLREGDSILTWKLQFPALGTIVSYLGNSRVLPWKLQFLMPETTVCTVLDLVDNFACYT